ncbi:hypothetical protein OG21DRAFT_1485495 [Imleria badia]|nr:hypothetical protein OG21DRAFT_1485495 [Imleria badia]
MSSALQYYALTTLFQYNYVTVSILTVVGYDYVLTFANEVEYIWSKPWTWVSTLFIFVCIELPNVRYFGLYNVIVSVLGSSFLPGPAKHSEVYIHRLVSPLAPTVPSVYSISECLQGEILGYINAWTFLFFFGAAEFVMILRIWAMYNRSRVILGTLLTLFTLEIISTLLAVAIDSDPKNMPVVIYQILDFSFCVLQATSPVWTNVAVIFQITQGAAVCMLAIVQSARQSVEMYRLTKQCQLNRYMSLLIKQGILSFLVVLLFNLINVLSVSGTAPTGGWKVVVLVILEYVPIYTLTPRFILNMRELYAHDVQGRRGEGIDTGFGVSLSGRDAGGMEMVFADVEQNEELDDVEEIPMEVVTTQPV